VLIFAEEGSSGFCWQGTNLFESVDDRSIMGTSWNGPRLFGLRSGEE
jgi:hypothetical protein